MSRSWRLSRLMCRMSADAGGVSAVEFSLVLPVMLVVFFGGFQLSQGLAAYRKVTATARTVADLATQYTTMSATDVSNVLNASSQIMVPYPTSTLTIVLTQINKPLTGAATVSWSKALNGTALAQGSQVTLPLGVCQPGASVVRADVTYIYTPPVGYGVTGSFTMRDSLYMSPRQTQSINYTGT